MGEQPGYTHVSLGWIAQKLGKDILLLQEQRVRDKLPRPDVVVGATSARPSYGWLEERLGEFRDPWVDWEREPEKYRGVPEIAYAIGVIPGTLRKTYSRAIERGEGRPPAPAVVIMGEDGRVVLGWKNTQVPTFKRWWEVGRVKAAEKRSGVRRRGVQLKPRTKPGDADTAELASA